MAITTGSVRLTASNRPVASAATWVPPAPPWTTPSQRERLGSLSSSEATAV